MTGRGPILNLAGFIDWAVDQVTNDNDVVLPVSGRERVGKSTFIYKLAKAIARRLGITFGVEDYAFRTSQYVVMSRRKGRRRINVLDEPKGINSMETMTAENREFIDHLTVCGELNQIHLLAIPRHKRLAADIKDHRAIWRVYIARRGLAFFYKAYRSEHGAGTFWGRRFSAEFKDARGDPEWQRILDAKHEYVVEGGREQKYHSTEDDAGLDEEERYEDIRSSLLFLPEAIRTGGLPVHAPDPVRDVQLVERFKRQLADLPRWLKEPLPALNGRHQGRPVSGGGSRRPSSI